MKSLILLGLFSIALFARTIVVDDDYSWFSSACESGDRTYSTIDSALRRDRDVDVIKICPGTYNESNLKINKNIVIESTTGNKDDVIVFDNNNNIWGRWVGYRLVIYSSKRKKAILGLKSLRMFKSAFFDCTDTKRLLQTQKQA